MADPSIRDLAYRGLAAALGGPVDIATMFMRPFGYKTPDQQVVGGSEWIGKKMEDMGIVSSARSPLQEFAASMIVPSPDDLYRAAAMAPALIGSVKGIGKIDDALRATSKVDDFSNFPTSVDRTQVRNLAEEFANRFNQMGFETNVIHSGSKLGPSSYIEVSDPTTGRYLKKPIRISDHSKGPFEHNANENVLNPREDFEMIVSALKHMRSMGETLVIKREKYAQQLIEKGVKPRIAYRRARDEVLSE